MPKPTITILQIIPSPGWYVVYKLAGGELNREPLSCWALLEYDDDGDIYRAIDGYDMGADGLFPCSDIGNFSHFAYGEQA